MTAAAASMRRIVQPIHIGRDIYPRTVRMDCRNSSQKLGGRRFGRPLCAYQRRRRLCPNMSSPTVVLLIIWRRDKPRPSLPVPDLSIAGDHLDDGFWVIFVTGGQAASPPDASAVRFVTTPAATAATATTAAFSYPNLMTL